VLQLVAWVQAQPGEEAPGLSQTSTRFDNTEVNVRRPLSVVVIGVTMAIAQAAFGPSTAFANHDTSMFAYSTNGSARAEFYTYGEHLYACDTKSDGLRAVAIVEMGNYAWYAYDTDGNNGNCAGHIDLDIIDHTNIIVKACARDGAYGPLLYCHAVPAFA
jgi:hypothetical protein